MSVPTSTTTNIVSVSPVNAQQISGVSTSNNVASTPQGSQIYGINIASNDYLSSISNLSAILNKIQGISANSNTTNA